MPETSAILPPKQPLINRRQFRRFIIGIIAIVVIGAVIWVVQTVRDFDFPRTANTIGDIAAIQYFPGGSQAVLIKPDGTVTPSQNYHDGIHDRDPVWRPDGNRLYFTSDREPNQMNLYRWNPGSGKVERRTATNGAYANLIYSGDDPSSGKGLISMGGMIVEFDPVTGDTTPILPPTQKNTGQSSEGRISNIEGSLFAPYGTSFKSACWFDGGKYVVCVMRGENGEILLMQDMTPITENQLPPPYIIMAGDSIDIAYSRTSKQVAYTLQGFRFPDPNSIPPQFIQNGKVIAPIRHMVGLLDPKSPNTQRTPGSLPFNPLTVVASKNDKNVFGDPVFAPDGNSVILTVGVYNGDGLMDVKGLIGMPAREGGGSSPALIHKGPAAQVTFSADSKTVGYVERRADGLNVIHTMNIDGSDDKAITEGKGSFGQPKFSPQSAAPSQ